MPKKKPASQPAPSNLEDQVELASLVPPAPKSSSNDIEDPIETLHRLNNMLEELQNELEYRHSVLDPLVKEALELCTDPDVCPEEQAKQITPSDADKML